MALTDTGPSGSTPSQLQSFASLAQQGAAKISAAKGASGGGRLSGFMKAVKGAASGVESMASAIGSSFGGATDAASRMPAATRVFGSELASRVKTEAETPGTPGYRFMRAPLLGAATLIPGADTGVGRKISGMILPSPHHVLSDVKEVASHPSLGAGGATLNDVFQVATAPLLAAGAARGVRGVGTLAERAGGLSSEVGAVKPGFARSAEEVFMAGRKALRVGQLAETAGETPSAARTAVKAAKALVEPETGLVMTKAERAGSGLVDTGVQAAKAVNPASAAHVASAVDAETATTAAEVTAKKPSGFAAFVRGKGAGLVKELNPVRSVGATAREVASAGKVVLEAVTHPQLLPGAKPAASVSADTAAGARPLSAPIRALGAGLRITGHGAQAVGHSFLPLAEAAGAEKVVAAKLRPSAAESGASAATAQDRELAANMNMDVEAFRAIRGMSDVQRGALVSGLKVAEARGLGALDTAAKSTTMGTLKQSIAGQRAASEAKRKSKELLSASVKPFYAAATASTALGHTRGKPAK